MYCWNTMPKHQMGSISQYCPWTKQHWEEKILTEQGFEPGAAGGGAQMLSLCYAPPLLFGKIKTFLDASSNILNETKLLRHVARNSRNGVDDVVVGRVDPLVRNLEKNVDWKISEKKLLSHRISLEVERARFFRARACPNVPQAFFEPELFT